MDPVFLARVQFALTVGFHFLFPPLSIGLAWLVFWFMHRYRRTGEQDYARHARFWTKLLAITFAVGVATGITMEFQFGTNWAAYSRFVGDIFGAPLAAEGLTAFFLESAFMGVLLFGWKRFSTRVMWFAALMVAVGSTLSAFWIIVANSWMQTPAGFHIVGGRAELTDFWAAVFNPSTVPRYLHTIVGCLITGSFFMLGVSAWYLKQARHVAFAKRSLVVGLVVAFLASVAQLGVGHYHAIQVHATQPLKLATFEGVFETQRHAPLLLFGLPSAEAEAVEAEVALPGMLSFLVGFDTSTEIQGLKDFPRDEWPPVRTTFLSFHLMFLLGGFFIAFTALGLFLLWRKRLFQTRWYLTVAFGSLWLPLLANELGWTAAEVGRQPWAVYRMPGMRTAEAVSVTVSAGELLASIVMFVLVYALLGWLWIRLLRRQVRQGPEPAAAPDDSHRGAQDEGQGAEVPA